MEENAYCYKEWFIGIFWKNERRKPMSKKKSCNGWFSDYSGWNQLFRGEERYKKFLCFKNLRWKYWKKKKEPGLSRSDKEKKLFKEEVSALVASGENINIILFLYIYCTNWHWSDIGQIFLATFFINFIFFCFSPSSRGGPSGNPNCEMSYQTKK